jgi:hypothetical protein
MAVAERLAVTARKIFLGGALLGAVCRAAVPPPATGRARPANLALELAANRQARALGTALGAVLVAGALAAGDASPDVFDGAVSRGVAAGAPLLAAGTGALLAAAAVRDASRCWRDAAPLPPPAYGLGLAVVALADGGRGEGLFAAAPLVAGEYIGAYPGDRLSEAALLARYPDGLTCYAFGLVGGPLAGADVYLDADPRHYVEGEGEREARSGATHKMNHAAAAAANVRRDVLHLPRWPWARSRVRFFTSRAIAAGEELRFDYGPDYDWAALGITPSE